MSKTVLTLLFAVYGDCLSYLKMLRVSVNET